MSSSLPGEPGSFDAFDLISDPVVSCALCFSYPGDLPMLPDHPIYAALTQDPFPSQLSQLSQLVMKKEK